jgi:hypothetical protein
MTDEQAYNLLMKITNFYNKKLYDEQVTIWINELKPLDEIISQKAAENLKTNILYTNLMPTIPQFLTLYKSLSKLTAIKTIKEQDYCYVCNNKGFVMMRTFNTNNNVTYVYDFPLHCDCCEKGKLEETRTNTVHSEPISMYYDINELANSNRIKREHTLRKKSRQEESKIEKIKVEYALISQIYGSM